MPPTRRRLTHVAVALALGTALPAIAAAGNPGLDDPLGLFGPPSPPVLPALPTLTPDGGLGTLGDTQPPLPGPLDALQPGDRERHKLQSKAAVPWATVSSEVVVRAPEPPREAPFERGEWSHENKLEIPVTGPLTLFGQANLSGDYSADQNMTVVSRTGLEWKMPLGEGSAFELRGGSALKYSDAMHLTHTQEPGTVLLELEAKMPLLAGVGLEYSGHAQPALTPVDHPKLDQDLGLAFPVSGGKFKLGAKHHWEQLQTPQPWNGNMELYVGVEIGR